jgi:hypothetical protein
MATIFRHKVVANTVTFNDVLPASAVAFGVDIMDGWKDSGDPEESSVELGSYRDGVSSASFFPIRSKFITIGGYVYATSEANAEAVSDLLVRDAFPRNRSFPLYRYEAVPKFMNVRRSGPVEFDWSAVQNGFRWSTVVMAEDPFKYSLAAQVASTGVSGGIVSGHTFPVTFPMTFGSGSSVIIGAGITNAGTAYSHNFTARIVGPLSKGAWRLANDTTGDSIGFNVGLISSDQLVIDFLNQTATLNGSPISTDYTGSFWQLAPGSNVIRLYAEFDPGASATITAYSAWE